MDQALFQAINNLSGKYPMLDIVMIFSAKYLPVAFVLALVILYLTWQYTQQRTAFLSGVSALIALGIAQIITFLFPRPRPYTAHAAHLMIAPSPDPSFPSDHATFCFAIATMIWLYNRRLGTILLGLAALVSFSRAYVGIHYPMDVVGGGLVGVAVSLLIDYIAKLTKSRALLDKLFTVMHGWRLAAKAE